MTLTPTSLLIVLGSLLSGAGLFAQPTSIPVGGPVQGTWEGEIQTARWPVFLTLRLVQEGGRVTGSLDLLGRTLPASEVRAVGDSVSVTVPTGEGGASLAIAATLRGGRLDGTLIEGTHALPLSLRRVPVYPTPRDRVEAWEQDIDALATRFIEADRSFTAGERALFLEHLESTRVHLAELTDDQVVIRLASAIALGRNAHSRLYILRNDTRVRRLPIRLWWFSDGLYVVRTTPEHRALLGCRVDSVEGVEARQARDLVAPAFAGNPSWVDYMSAYSLTSPEVLHGSGVTPSSESVGLGVSGCPHYAATHTRLLPLPLAPRDEPVEAWWDLSPRHPGVSPVGEQVLAEHEALPLYLQNPTRNYWFEHVDDADLLYVQFNRAQNDDEEALADFGERLLAAIDEREPRAFVLDVRFNTGGNLFLGSDLMETLEERTRGIPRFVIVARSTFSAGITAVAQWRQAGGVTLVGEPVGDELETWGEGGNILLPNSGLNAHFANGLHSYSPAPCPADTPCYDLSVATLAPDVPVATRWADYVAGRDPSLEAVLAHLAGAAE